jgi:hypothetical protein
MKREILERELKKIGVNLNGWLPVLDCDTCGQRWEPFNIAVGPSAPTARLDYWRCPNRCNAGATLGRELQTVVPKYLVINDIPGMIFGEEDRPEFERYVHSMDATQIINRED